jgi:hypothetical protein
VESNWTRTYRALKISLGETFTKLRWWQRKCAVANVERDLPWHFGLFSRGASSIFLSRGRPGIQPALAGFQSVATWDCYS